MSRINVWIPDRELKTIDEYCQKHQYHRGVFLWKSALTLINNLSSKQSIISCDYCRTGSVGHFKVTTYDSTLGEQDLVKNLCKLHLASAQREGAVKKVEG